MSYGVSAATIIAACLIVLCIDGAVLEHCAGAVAFGDCPACDLIGP
jgi:hypothetical protein